MSALAARLRPSSFDDVLGHESVVKAVQKLLAKPPEERPRCFTFVGQPGGGKTTLARLIAEYLVPDAECRGMDVDEIDAASNSGADDTRALRERVQNRPMSGGNRVVIVDEAHRLSATAKDVLLKIMEDGPAHLYWIICTSEGDKLPEAIKRRGNLFELKPVSANEIKRLLVKTARKEGIFLPEVVRDRIIEAAEGSPGKALAFLETSGAMCREDMSGAEIEEAASYIMTSANAAGSLPKLLLASASKLEIVQCIAALKAEGKDAEGTRRGVLGYMESAVLGNWYREDRNRPLEIMEVFCAGNTFDSGWSGLIVLATNAAGRN
jgi:DNA polymerase III gamma/tau subunit